MDNKELKEKLEKYIIQNEKKIEINFNKNKGLSGKSIVTTDGMINDAYYKGKIQAYKNILELLNKQE